MSKAFPGLMEGYPGRLSHKNRNLHEMSSMLEKYSVSRQGSSTRSLEGFISSKVMSFGNVSFQQSQILRLSPALSEAQAMGIWTLVGSLSQSGGKTSPLPFNMVSLQPPPLLLWVHIIVHGADPSGPLPSLSLPDRSVGSFLLPTSHPLPAPTGTSLL